jgi:hypothetical protein
MRALVAGFGKEFNSQTATGEFAIGTMIVDEFVNGEDGLLSVQIELTAAGAAAGLAYFTGLTDSFTAALMIFPAIIGVYGTILALPLATAFDEAGRDAADRFINSLTGAVQAKNEEGKQPVLEQGKTIGKFFADGIMVGLDEKLPELTTKAANIAAWLRATVEAGLDMNSPSRVGISIGNLFVEGIALGLEGSQSRIEQAAGTITNSLTNELANMQATVASQSAAMPLPNIDTSTVSTWMTDAFGSPVDTSFGPGGIPPWMKKGNPSEPAFYDPKYGQFVPGKGFFVGNAFPSLFPGGYTDFDPTARVSLRGQASLQGAGMIPSPTPIAAPSATTTDTLLLQQVLGELQTQNAIVKEASVRPLIGEYNVATTKQPQSPDQLAQDAAFVKALLG